MDPTQQPSAFSIDYLNQISPQTPQKKLINKTLLRLIIIVGILAIITISIIIANSSGQTVKTLEKLSARLQATAKIASDSQPKLKSTELKSLNSNLKIYLTNTNRDMTTQLALENIDTAKLDKNLIADEANTTMTARLEDARLNAVFDRTYAREMAYQISTIETLMQEIDNTSPSANIKTLLSSTYTNLLPTQKAFEDFNAVNG
jgi:hypothetical protein